MDHRRVMAVLEENFPTEYRVARDHGRQRMAETLAARLDVTQAEAAGWLDHLVERDLLRYVEPPESNQAASLETARYGDAPEENPNRSGQWVIGLPDR